MYGYVYKLTNILNGKTYIGQHKSKNIDEQYWGSGTYITRAIEKYGTSVFNREILCWCNTKEELDKAEADYIDKEECFYPKGYKLTAGGFGGDTLSKFSKDDLAEVKKKMSLSSKGKPKTNKHKKHMSDYMKKYVKDNPDWWKSLQLKGQEVAKKNKAYLKGAEARRGKGSWNKGIKMPRESCEKMRLHSARRGQHWFTNGKENIICDECPNGYYRGRTINH